MPIDTNVSVVEITKHNCEITEIKIPGIQSFHSVEHDTNGMMFWRYFGMGIGKFIPLSKDDMLLLS